MEDSRFSNSLENVDPSRCIICFSEVSRKLSGGLDGRENEDHNKRKEILQQVAPKSVVNDPGFLETFNIIWQIFYKSKCRIGGAGGEEISLESVAALTEEGSGSKVAFSITPTFCKLCCEKVVSVAKLMKVVRQQVREIKMLLEESRRKAEERQSNVTTIEEDNNEENMDLNGEDWLESTVDPTKKLTPQKSAVVIFDEELSNSSVKSDPDATTAMECDNEQSSLEREGNVRFSTQEDNEEWNESNFPSDDDDDPDYIKSEDENPNDDDEDTSEDEKPLTVGDRLDVVTTETDPLEIPSKSGTRRLAKRNKFKFNFPVSCEVPGCDRKFNSASGFHKHQMKCHPTPAQELKNLEKLRKQAAKSSSSSLEIFTCDLEACNQKLASKQALFHHQKQCHLKLMIQLGRIGDPSQNKFHCSCGRSFPSKSAHYDHRRKNAKTHPESQHKLTGKRVMVTKDPICDFCDETVKLSNMLEHLTNHVGAEYVVKCPNFDNCGLMFTHSKRLNERHLSYKTNCKKIALEKKFDLICETCGFITDKRISLPKHVANEHERGTLPKNLKCPVAGCEKMFAVKQSIYFHLHTHRSRRRKTAQFCMHCSEKIKIEEMEEHLKGKHGVLEVIGCTKCPYKFPGREDLVEHLYDHRHAGLSCDLCDNQVTFTGYTDFREHYFGMHGICPKRLQCDKCPAVFWGKAYLNAHTSNEHKETVDKAVKKNQKKGLRCDLCFDGGNVVYLCEALLISHKIKVHGADPFTCDICGQTFHNKTVFNKHKKEHAGMKFKKEWKCEVEGCGKVFSRKPNLKMHQKNMHCAEKRHVCEECGKGYAFSSELKAHQDIVHLGLRPWVCEECGEGFTAMHTLKRHKLIHTGERPFGCEICGQRFRHKGVLKTHLKSHEEKGADFKPNGPMKKIRKRKAQ